MDLLRRSVWCGIRGLCAATDEWRTSVDFYLRGEKVYSYPVEWRFGNTASHIVGISFDAVTDPTATVTGTDFAENSLYLDGFDGATVFRWVIPPVRCLVQCDEVLWNWIAVNCQNQVAVPSSLFGVLACLSEEA